MCWMLSVTVVGRLILDTREAHSPLLLVYDERDVRIHFDNSPKPSFHHTEASTAIQLDLHSRDKDFSSVTVSHDATDSLSRTEYGSSRLDKDLVTSADGHAHLEEGEVDMFELRPLTYAPNPYADRSYQ